MANKKKAKNNPAASGKAAAKAAKNAKIQKKSDQKTKKKAAKAKEDVESDGEDLEAILEKMRRDWEDAHKVTEELVEGPPSRRANATFTPCPSGNYLWCIGGEFFGEDKNAYFYNDVFRYNPEKDEWRKYVSHTCPGPRSAHAVVASPAGGGKLFLFGGEFSSLHQTNFHHYRDFWCFDISTHMWDRIETKIRPSARSGHRMAMWKHYIVLFGGFYDPGLRTNYLDDLWIFDTQEYEWKHIEFKANERRPSPRSGFSFLPVPDGILLHGGYCKEYHKGKRPIGVMLEDTWFLRMSMPTASGEDTKSRSSSNLPIMSWERRKRSSTSFAPSLRSGCTMALWANKNTGVLFGGVTDEDNDEESLESVFYNDLYGYQITGNGRWTALVLKTPKQKASKAKKKKKKKKLDVKAVEESLPEANEGRDFSGESDDEPKPWEVARSAAAATQSPNSDQPTPTAEDEADPDDPNLTKPLPRYNAMLAVLKNTLYIYGGIFERGTREYTLDDYYSLQLDKLDKYVCLKPTDIDITAGSDESSSEDDDDDSSNDDEGDDKQMDEDIEDETSKVPDAQKPSTDDIESKTTLMTTQLKETLIEDEMKQTPDDLELRAKATAFMGVSKDTSRSAEDVMSTPLPGETLAMFYARSREYWTQKAFSSSSNDEKKGKMLRRNGFALAQERYKEYKPLLMEVEKILKEAGLDEEEIKMSAAAGPAKASNQSRNRR